MNNILHKNYFKDVTLFLSVVLMIVFTSRLITTFDENYTLELMRHSFKSILSIDAIDVHPPLYYILLKLYLSVFTFWTKSIFIKIIFARMLSLIFSLCTFIILYKSLHLIHINNDWQYSLMLFIILPNVTGINAMNNEQLVDIRMYSLAALFISAIFYFTIKYYFNNNIIYIILITILAILSAYTNYYAGLMGGSFILFNFLKYFHNKENCIRFFISGLILILSYLVWLPVLIHQANASNNIFYCTINDIFKQCAVLLAFILIFLIPLIFTKQILNSYIFNQISFVICLSAIIPIIISFIKDPMFRFRYLYPIMLIFEFISINIVANNLIKYKNFRKKIYSFGLLCLLIFSMGVSVFSQIHHFYPETIQFYKNCNDYKNKPGKYVYLNHKGNILDGSTQTNINTEYSFYLTNIGKHVICKGLVIPNAKDYLPLYKHTIQRVNK